MLHQFLDGNRETLAARCRTKATSRSFPGSPAAPDHGVPTLIDELIEMLRSELAEDGVAKTNTLTVGIGRSAEKHGADLLRQGFAVEQVVHGYGDLCQALTELAQEKHEPISVAEFHTFNRCLDVAIADSVREFGRQRDEVLSEQRARSLNERLGSLAHEQRNLLNTAMLAFSAIKSGQVATSGATAAILDRSLEGLRDLIDRALADVRLTTGLHTRIALTALDVILQEVSVAARLDADARGIEFITTIENGISLEVDRQMVSSALANLLQNAFKFTRPGGRVHLAASLENGHVMIEVADQCGGLPPGVAEDLFLPFEQRSLDRSGVGLGLSISRRAVKANGGTLHVRDLPGTGCVFTIAF
jgi:signal transduction histidine kinase